MAKNAYCHKTECTDRGLRRLPVFSDWLVITGGPTKREQSKPKVISELYNQHQITFSGINIHVYLILCHSENKKRHK